jgi:VWFA-related protein
MGTYARILATSCLVLGVALFAPAFDGAHAQAQQNPPSQAPPSQPPPGAAPAGQPPAQGQQTPPPPPQGQRPPVIKQGINFVSVDVIVTDKRTGDVVLNLTKDDFEVRADKKPQQVETFDVVKIDPLKEQETTPKEIRSSFDEENEARQPNVRLFIILLDDYHVRRGSDLAVRKPLIDFVQNQLGPQDMVAIMYPLTPVTELTFTRNHDSLVAAINGFLGRKGIYEPRNDFEERYFYYPVATVEAIRNDVSMGALKGAAVRLGGMREGRKSIIFVSEGLVSSVPAQLNDPSAAMPGFGNPARRSPGVDPQLDPRAQSAEFFNEADLNSRLREVYDIANRNNTSIYAVDPRGLAAFEYDVNQGVGLQTDRKLLNASLDTLRVLADNTDGRAIINRNDLAAGMKQIMRDSSGYYLLGYTSNAAPTDGKFHNIDVHVKRPNVEVRARKGYWAYTNEDVARATAPPKPDAPAAVTTALNKIAEPAGSGRVARYWVGTDRAQSGARVTFVWEPLTGAGSSDRSEGSTAVRAMLTATAQDGHPLFRGRVPDTDAATAPVATDGASASNGANGANSGTPAVAVTSATSGASFDAPPGPVELRIVFENARGQVIDSTTQDLTIPDYGRTQVSIGTPRVFRARTARDMLLIRKDPNALPTATRDFSRAERLLIRFDAYASDGSAPQVTSRLLNRAGQAMADVPVQTNAGQPYQIDFPLASLAAGEYLLELNAKTAAGSAQQLVAFRIGT